MYKRSGQNSGDLALKRTIAMVVVPTPNEQTTTPSTEDRPIPRNPIKSIKCAIPLYSSTFGLSTRLTQRRLNVAQTWRRDISHKISLFSAIQKRRGFTHVTQEVLESVQDWILRHPLVIQSPIAKDCIKIPIPGTTDHEIKPKMLLQCSVRELHNDLVKDSNDGGCSAARKDGKIIVSDTALRYMMPPQVRKFSKKHKKCVDVKFVSQQTVCTLHC